MTDQSHINLSRLNSCERQEIWAAIKAFDPDLQQLLIEMGQTKAQLGGEIEIPRQRYEQLVRQWRSAPQGETACATK